MIVPYRRTSPKRPAVAIAIVIEDLWTSNPMKTSGSMTVPFFFAECISLKVAHRIWATWNGHLIWFFAGADIGAETLARAMTVIETVKMNGLDPQAYLADVLDRIHDYKINRLDELLPWNREQIKNPCAVAA